MYALVCCVGLYESVLMRWMKLNPNIRSEVSQKQKHQYSILVHIYAILKEMMTLYSRQQKRHRCEELTDFWTMWEKVRVERFERIALIHVHYQM